VLPARGSERDRESLILHRGEHAYVIFNAYPYNPGHLMVVPYEHLSRPRGPRPRSRAELFELGCWAAEVLEERLGAQGINLGMNLGAAAGAGIADHLHLHAVPRWGGDTNFISVVGAARVLPRRSRRCTTSSGRVRGTRRRSAVPAGVRSDGHPWTGWRGR
jgi:ATP adenylyltransferase